MGYLSSALVSGLCRASADGFPFVGIGWQSSNNIFNIKLMNFAGVYAKDEADNSKFAAFTKQQLSQIAALYFRLRIHGNYFVWY